MKVIDISMELSAEMETYTSLPPIRQTFLRRIGPDNYVNVTEIEMNTHVGTHVDAPGHFVEDGRMMDQVTMEELVGNAQLIEVPAGLTIDVAWVDQLALKESKVIFRFGEERFDRKLDYFTDDAAKRLYERGVRLIGTDCVSIDSKSTGDLIHRTVFGLDMLVVPGLVVAGLEEKTYDLLVFPIATKGAEGAPARVVLLDQESPAREILDISEPLHDQVIKYKSLKPYKRTWLRDFNDADGNRMRMSSFQMTSHVGTHIDAPIHYVADGKNMDEVPVDRYLAKAQVLELPEAGAVTAEFLDGKIEPRVKALLFKYGRDRLDGRYDYFSKDGVEAMVEAGIEIMGTDNFNVDTPNTKRQIHLTSLGAGMSIFEVLNLNDVEEGIYDVIALPLKIKGAEAAPARIVLVK